ncbi:MAG: TraB/GumN family protein [Desulfobacteraceae bacterium]|nr:TraB/GumN family protein [Desulfobacteraceae bacterium]
MENLTNTESEMQNITYLEKNGKKYTIIGTAHVSKKSAELVEKTIDELKPDTVCVELCQSRFESIKNQKKFEDTDIIQVIKEKKVYLLLSSLILSSFQKKIADKMEIKPGQEMIAAIDAAERSGAETVLADRDLQITLKRAWKSMGFFEKIKIISQLIFAAGSDEEISEEEIERLKNSDVLETLLDEIGKSHPKLKNALITERDKYLCQKIKNSQGENIIAVVGAGHVPGIKEYFDKEIEIEPLEELPPPGKLLKFLKWGIPALIILLICGGFFVGGKSTGSEMIAVWIGLNAVMAGIGAVLAFAHPLTIVTAAVAAPFTSLNPMVAAGWVSGLTEAVLRKPKVKDLSELSNDITSFKGFWKNNLTRILLVVVFTNVGSSIGTFAAFPFFLKIMGKG